jgi:hypothetical protein
MHRSLIMTLIILVFPFAVYAQKENYNVNVDERTYELFNKSDWENLREIGYGALDAGIDFYYLRLRMGISYYKEKNYMSAIPHFEKALAFRSSDTLALEYLYYSYLFSGLRADANTVAGKFSALLINKTGHKKPEVFSGLYTEGGYTFVPGFNDIKNKNKATQQEPALTYKLAEKETYFNISLIHSFGDRMRYFHGINTISVNSSLINNGYSKPILETPLTTKQFEYYGNLNSDPGKYFNVFAALHYLHVTTQEVIPPPPGIPPPKTLEVFETSSDEFVYTAGVSKRFGNIEPGLSALYSDLSGGNQHREALTFTYYPFGNLALYSATGLILNSNRETQSAGYKSNFIFDEKIGFKISDNLWGEAVITAGNMLNYSENNGFIVYNVVDKMKYKIGSNLLVFISKNLEFSIRYLFISTEYKTFPALINGEITYKTESLYKHKLIGSLQWTF